MKDELDQEGLEKEVLKKQDLEKDSLKAFDVEEWEDAEEETAHSKVTMLTFLGLILVAAIICVILWHFTHLDKAEKIEGEAGNSTVVTKEAIEESTEESALEGSTLEEAVLDMSITGEIESQEAVTDTQETVSEEVVSEESEVVTEESVVAKALEGTEVEENLSEGNDVQFTEVNEEVTAKDVTNLRLKPSTTDAENVVAQLKNGETLLRTGVNSSAGWSRLLYNGEVVYAVSQYLTTDLNYKTPIKQGDPNRIITQDGRTIIFEDCNDNITPKEYVNLRTEPSTSQGQATVKCQVKSGEVVHRTGYSQDAGWSRVEYNGEVLYVVSSFVKAAQ